MNGIERIASERRRQIDVEGWKPEHDNDHAGGDLAYAAIAYAHEGVASQGEWANEPRTQAGSPGRQWPWDAEWWKPSPDPIRNLEKAGALIAAEIDRLLRAEAEGEKD